VQNVEELQQVRADDFGSIHELAQQLRVDGIRSSTAAGSGHPTSSMSAADLMAVLMARHLRYDWDRPGLDNNDHLIFSKGHASPLVYAMFKAAGAVTDEEMMTFRKMGSRLQGHPTPILPWVDVATGSLGQGLPIAVGVALAGRYLDKLPYHVWVVCGDSELAEGSMWEALDKAAHYGLGNLTAIFDVNRLGQRGETEFGWDTEVYRRRVEAFGCEAVVIDGHDASAIDAALGRARSQAERPLVVIARTIKGKGFSEIENKEGWHGKTLPEDMAERAIREMGGVRDLRVAVQAPEPGEQQLAPGGSVTLPTYSRDDKVATRKAYGDALKALGVRPEVVALDGEVSNSTHSEEFGKAYPERFFEMWIAEQQLVASAVGLSVRGYKPFASTFAAFFSRAYDFIRMAAISQADIKLAGSHAGVEIGQDGPSQMALEDIASIRAITGSTVLYPSDPVSTARLVERMADTDGIVYMRTTRGAYPTLYENGDDFKVGGSRVLRSSAGDRVTLVGAGVTLHNSLEAAAILEKEGIAARVIDLYSIKPLDVATLREAMEATGGRLVVSEDHYPEGGIGGAVLEAMAEAGLQVRMAHCAVRQLPGSGKPAELMDAAGISARHIVDAARGLLAGPSEQASNPLFKLSEFGQSVWYDDITRDLVRGDGLQKLIKERAVVGITTNPSIFEKAMSEGESYDADLRRLAEGGASPEEMFMDVALDDVGKALDTLRPIYEDTDGLDGRVSMEVLASLAYDTAGTQEMVREIWSRVSRPNLMVKIPATNEGIPAIEEMLYEGHSINITLIFGLEYYRRVAEAYVKALERRVSEGKPIDGIGSVASFFVSRVDTKVDKALDALVEAGKVSEADASKMKGRAAVANAKLAYEAYNAIFKSDRFRALEAKGARPQRCLWASTGTKNPAYSDVLYIDELIGPDTVNTIPLKTLDAYADHGNPAPRLSEGVEEARALMAQLDEVGVDMGQVTDELITEGVKAFEDAFDKLLEQIRTRSQAVTPGK
jgi:transketolase